MLDYVLGQLARRLTTRDSHPDPATAERARQRAEQWQRLLSGMETGQLEVGSRTPVREVPAWVTLEVLTGGFASGAMLAAGPLQPHEEKLMQELQLSDRAQLNGHFLSPTGLTWLRDMLASGCYQLELPEEGAWLVLAWLEQNGHLEQAQQLLEALLPFCHSLRFYPIPDAQAWVQDLRVHLESVGEVRQRLESKNLNPRILAQRESIQVWLPLYDEILSLFQETLVDGWPCRTYPADWEQRRAELISRYGRLRQTHRLCGRPQRTKHSLGCLLDFLQRGPQQLTGREVGRLRLILQRSERKRGLPGSPSFQQARRLQHRQIQAPTYQQQAIELARRLADLPQTGGIDQLETFEQPGLEGFPVPACLLSKLERCLHASLQELVERGVIGSGEVLARVLPQMVSQLRAAEFEDDSLGRLFAAIYRAFRQRRSLLLLDLKSQVKLEELPWVAALTPFRGQEQSSRRSSRQALESLAQTALRAFPQAILPNRLIKEMRALASGAGLDVIFTEELAADIFAGRFSPHFSRAAQRSQQWLSGTLYQVYYSVAPGPFDNLAQLCAERAGLSGPGRVSANGQIIEQQQVLTTHNLAALFQALDLKDRVDCLALARRCFLRVCQRLQLGQGHQLLLELKNSAYAWRQMIFFLSMAGPEQFERFGQEAEQILQSQPQPFQKRFQPAWQGLLEAGRGQTPKRPFYGWTSGKHWLLPALTDELGRPS